MTSLGRSDRCCLAILELVSPTSTVGNSNHIQPRQREKYAWGARQKNVPTIFLQKKPNMGGGGVWDRCGELVGEWKWSLKIDRMPSSRTQLVFTSRLSWYAASQSWRRPTVSSSREIGRDLETATESHQGGEHMTGTTFTLSMSTKPPGAAGGAGGGGRGRGGPGRGKKQDKEKKPPTIRKSCDFCNGRKKKCDGDGVNKCRYIQQAGGVLRCDLRHKSQQPFSLF